MRRALAAWSAIAAIGCGEQIAYAPEPATPTVAYYALPAETAPPPPPPPPPRTRLSRLLAATPEYSVVAIPGRDEIIQRWQLPPTNIWARYAKYTLPTALDAAPRTAPMPDVVALPAVMRAQETARCLAAAGLPNDTMWIADLRGAASVAFGATLSASAREPVSVVPTFNNWPAERELVPAEETLAALVRFSPRLPGPRDSGTRPVFLLDSWRLAYRFDVPDDDVTDNRYVLGPTDLPDASTLRAQGISRVVYIVEDLADTPLEEDDLHATFRDYQANGIGIFVIDLAVCAQPIARGRIDEVIAPRAYVCVERVTLLDDEAFYMRAHGGFGGVHVVPGGGVRWSGGGG